MRILFRSRHGGAHAMLSDLLYFFAATSLTGNPASALNFTAVPSSNLDLSSLGRVGIVGDFSGISLFQYKEQAQAGSSTTGSDGLMARLPNGELVTVVSTDASITSMCSLTARNGTDVGVVLGGNFTRLGGQQATAMGLFNPNTSAITALPGLSGQVNAVFCDAERNTVYIGGSFIGPNSTNAITWDAETGFTALPFAGFNGPVKAITKASDGHIIFGGSFTGLGNDSIPTKQDGQIVNLSSANISASSSSTAVGFSEPANIVCKTNRTDGAGNTWLLQDGTAGSWQATFDFGFEPTKLRLWNTHQDGSGTKTWRFTALPLGGIMNFTYIDPTTGQNGSCTSECPLSNDTGVAYQDFHFVNQVGMNAFRIDISAWYGSAGGLDGIELFENDIFSYAIDRFNEPSCAGVASSLSSATATGPWKESPSRQSSSKYLAAQLASPIQASSASVTFTPDIQQAGNYSVNMYTPGCTQDNTCDTRGQVNITMSMVEGEPATSVQLFQTNNFDKYDQIYFGPISVSSGAFRPTVTLAPLAGQSLANLTIVAQRVGFTLINSTGGLNGLFEYDPSASSTNNTDFTASVFDLLSTSFSSNSAVTTLGTIGDVTYVAGNFTSTSGSNILAVNSKDAAVAALDGGLDGGISSLVVKGSSIFVGGSFNSTLSTSSSSSVTGLANIAQYDTTKNIWSPLGAGVDGPVVKVVAMSMNISSAVPEIVVALTGGFRHLLAFGSNSAVSVDGFAIWVPSQSNWLQNLDFAVPSVKGVLRSSVLDVPGASDLYGGSLSMAELAANGAATFTNTGVGSFGLDLLSSDQTTTAATGTVSKRDTSASSTHQGVITGLFDMSNNRNKTIMAGHFSAQSASGDLVQNLLIVDNKNNGTVTGVTSGSGISNSSTFVTLAVSGDTLFAGGNVTGSVNNADVGGLITYDLATDKLNTQPPALSGGGSTVTAIQIRPGASDVYVGGSFTSAGSLGCPGVCYYSISASQWNRPGAGLGISSSVSSMVWTASSTLVVAGNLSVNDTATVFLAKYDSSHESWQEFPGAAGVIPGPVDLLTLGSNDGSELWVAGTVASNNSLFLMKYDGKSWTDAFGASGQKLLSGTELRSLQVLSSTSKHASTALLSSNQLLMLTGSIVLADYGTVSAAIFDGNTFTPFALTTSGSGSTSAGSIASMFVQNSNFSTSKKKGHLPLVGVVLIGLAISLVLMLLIVAAGLLLDRIRKKRQGYAPAPTDRGADMSRIPPEELLDSLRKPGIPQV